MLCIHLFQRYRGRLDYFPSLICGSFLYIHTYTERVMTIFSDAIISFQQNTVGIGMAEAKWHRTQNNRGLFYLVYVRTCTERYITSCVKYYVTFDKKKHTSKNGRNRLRRASFSFLSRFNTGFIRQTIKTGCVPYKTHPVSDPFLWFTPL